MCVSLSHNRKIEKRKSIVFFRQYRRYRCCYLQNKMPCHSEIGQSKSLFLLTVALLCCQTKKLPFSHGNCDDRVVVPVQLANNIPSGKHKRFMFLYLVVHNNSLQCGQLSYLASS